MNFLLSTRDSATFDTSLNSPHQMEPIPGSRVRVGRLVTSLHGPKHGKEALFANKDSITLSHHFPGFLSTLGQIEPRGPRT